MEDRRLEEFARKLWSRHKEALEFLADRRPDNVGNVFNALRDRREELANALSGPNRQVVLDSDYKTIIRFAFAKWDDLPGFKLAHWTETKRFILLELKREADYLNAYLYLGRGNEAARQLYAGVLQGTRLHRPNSRFGRDWTCLAKKEILRVQSEDDDDMELSIAKVTNNLQEFARDVFNHFDPILATLEIPHPG